jgi:hypothetical protein
LGGVELRRVRRQSGAATGDGAKARERGRRCDVVLVARRGPTGKQRDPRVKSCDTCDVTRALERNSGPAAVC